VRVDIAQFDYLDLLDVRPAQVNGLAGSRNGIGSALPDGCAGSCWDALGDIVDHGHLPLAQWALMVSGRVARPSMPLIAGCRPVGRGVGKTVPIHYPDVHSLTAVDADGGIRR
jgi:hypothetical protein